MGGMGKGVETPMGSQPGNAPPDLGALFGGLAGMFAGKGMGKGTGAPTPAQQTCGAPDIGALMSMFAAKGMGKGNAAYPMDSRQPVGGEPCGETTQTAEPVQPVSRFAVSRSYEEEVRDLMDMGLVTDADTARDLLRSHGGDLSLVVATLTTD